MKKIILNYRPQDYQREIHNSRKRFRLARIGRRGGKTEFALHEIVKKSMEKPGLYWFIAPTYKQAKQIAWRRLKAILKFDPHWKFNEQELSATNKITGTILELKGADNEDSLRGVGLQGCILDECATMKSNVWAEIVRPMLADTQGWALFISTPKGKNWFYDLWNNAGDNWAKWHYPTTINTYVPQEEIDEAKKDTPALLFQQEYMAEFMDDATSVFKGIGNCIAGQITPPDERFQYLIGLDLAKTQDFTVICVLNRNTKHLDYFERTNETSWYLQKERIKAVSLKYNNALVVPDSTGVGDPIVEDLLMAGVSVYHDDKGRTGVKFTNIVKQQIIEKLIVAIEQRLITFPDIEVLINELRSFQYKHLPSGKTGYEAPEGKHDDCVIALALATWGIMGGIYNDVYREPEKENRSEKFWNRVKVDKKRFIANKGGEIEEGWHEV